MSFTPHYTITDKTLILVSSATASKEIIENSLIIPAWERKFQNSAISRSIHHSTALEGNKMELEDAKKVVEGLEVSTIRVRDLREIVNYREAVGLISGVGNGELTMGYMQKVQETLGAGILNEQYLGSFRMQNAVVINTVSQDVVFDPPKADDIDGEIVELINWYSDTNSIHPLLKAGVLHYEFVRIHPFADLNGRTARILTTWSLYNDGYDIKKFFSLEEYYDQDPKRYYDALESAHVGDMTEWLQYFVEGVSIELARIKDKVLSLNRDKKLINKFGQVALNGRQIKIIHFMEKNSELKNSDFDILFPKISDDTILRELKDLMAKKIVKKIGKTKAARYILK